MSNSKTLWYVLLIAWIAGSVYWHVCKIKQLCDADIVNSVVTDALPLGEPLLIADSTTLKLQATGNMTFAKNSASPNLTSVQLELDSLVSYLKASPYKQLIISGQYSSAQTNQTTAPNLGMARAQEIKKWLITQGIADSLIVLNSSLNDALTFANDSLSGGIQFDFNNTRVAAGSVALTEKELADQQRFESIFKPLDLYFPTASSQFIRTEQNQMFILAAKKYLAENADKKLILTGHTDDEDSAEWNLNLSRKRAASVKKQFIALGIGADRIITKGKGEWEPKASNATLEGKRANRRVNMVVR